MELEELLDEIDTAHRTARRVWDISNKQLETLPPSFYELTSLNVLYLNDNNFTYFPSDIASLTELCVLDLSGNNIVELPPEITKLTNLSSLFLYNNSITTLPKDFNRLTGLSHLSIGCNLFEKDIPNTIFDLVNLVSFSCCANKIVNFPRSIF